MSGKEGAQPIGQYFERRCRVGEQPHPAAQAAREVGEFSAHRLELLGHQPCVVDQCEPGRSWHDAAALALEQGRAQLALEVADALAGRCECQSAARGAMGDVAGVGDVQHQPQVDQVELHGQA